ncbi:MAG: PLDc N-terminal domain-containing protein [Dermatophilaceae bacterium]
MARFVLAVAAVALTLYALLDCLQTPSAGVRNLPKPAWILLILLLTVIGPIAWFFGGRPATRPPGGSGPPPGRPRGPEDDPDFLRSL